MNRRQFIKAASLAVAAAGLGPTLPRLARPVQAAKDHILIGRPLPLTRAVAAMAEGSPWIDDRCLAKMAKDNTCVFPTGGEQWVKGTKFKYEPVLVANGNYPDLPLDTKMKAVQEFHQQG